MSTEFVGADTLDWSRLWVKKDFVSPAPERLNPPVSCGFSREADEQHAPAAISDPFTKRS